MIRQLEEANPYIYIYVCVSIQIYFCVSIQIYFCVSIQIYFCVFVSKDGGMSLGDRNSYLLRKTNGVGTKPETNLAIIVDNCWQVALGNYNCALTLLVDL